LKHGLGNLSEKIMTRKVTLVGFALLAATLSACIWSGLFSSAATYVNCQYRVKLGMSLSEVESILGRGTIEAGSPENPVCAVEEVEGDVIYRWCANGWEIFVGFKDGRVCDKVIWYIDYL
jgi:hypothetical protein